ncbi:MFS general substrate transporter [Fistulina hepatica ATCC 64428]|uniref:MFS general substrate transporter n=1 Tax=Fistulina hepatica ATCC 64428 TaxID=1128425 RepID=A0A0D7AIU4_9AGAR|nr:MFS general substrate transporter [Fistulina hepatica ATCC 64428]
MSTKSLQGTDEKPAVCEEAVDVNNNSVPERGSTEREVAERRLVRILDWRLMPAIFVIFIMNYIDRNGITTARLQGMEEDLGLSDIQYDTVIAVLYATYCPCQIPSNMYFISHISSTLFNRPSKYIGGCVVAWGLFSALTGVTKNFGGILVCRVLLGIPEAAFYCGAMYFLSRWYTRKELAFRSAILYSGLLISNAFGALIAAGILANMNGVRGIRAWRWLFYIEGSITMTIGFMAMMVLPDYPSNTSWLSPNDRRLAQARLAEDAGEVDEDTATDSPTKGLIMALRDPRVIILAIMDMSQLLGLSYINFFPTLTETLGYSTIVTLLLQAPPWILSAIVCCVNAWNADRTGERFFHMTSWWWVCMVGYIIALCTMSVAGRYVSLFLMAVGYTGFALTLVWTANAIHRPPAKRAAAMGIVNGCGNIGNLIGSYTWKSVWGPSYHKSMVISLSAFALSSILSLTVRQMLVRDNKRLEENEKAEMTEMERMRVQEVARLEGISFEQAMKQRKGFRFLY